MPLLRSRGPVDGQETQPRLKPVIADIALSVESGSTFSEALAQHPKIFNRLYLNMIKAGEISGMLETSLQRLAGVMEKAESIKRKGKGGLDNPAAVAFVASGVIACMVFSIFPQC